MHDALVRLFAKTFGAPPRSVLEVPADGSSRKYFRMIAPDLRTAVGAFGLDREENTAFFSFTQSFRGIGLPVPELFAVDESGFAWLEEDLGDTTLFAALSAAREADRGAGELDAHAFPESMVPVYENVLRVLPRFQVDGGRVIDYGVAYPRAAFDAQSIAWDLNYFKYHFLKLAHIAFNEERLERDFDRLAAFLLEADVSHFLYRDFQSRNIMLRDDGPWFIDYQGGRRGALHYDVASLLYDAKASIPEPIRAHLLERYLDALEGHVRVDRDAFRERYRGYVLVRIMQAMGAYGYRGFFERKPRFLQSVPHAARNLQSVLSAGLPVELPELESSFHRIVDAFGPEAAPVAEISDLEVRITSFSYRRGYPDDAAGHGGGFVFDCRALPNPGRHLEYADLCGHDRSVAEYIERADAARAFWEHVRALVDAQIDEYLRRGFTSLSVAFGCTGGQHRSVYFVERLSRHLRERYPRVHVRVEHREQGRWPRPAVEPRASRRAEWRSATPEA